MNVLIDTSAAKQTESVLAHRCNLNEAELTTEDGLRIALTQITLIIPIQSGGPCTASAQGYLVEAVGGSIKTEMDLGNLTIRDPGTGAEYKLEEIR